MPNLIYFRTFAPIIPPMPATPTDNPPFLPNPADVIRADTCDTRRHPAVPSTAHSYPTELYPLTGMGGVVPSRLCPAGKPFRQRHRHSAAHHIARGYGRPVIWI